LIIQNRDGSFVDDHAPWRQQPFQQECYAEVPARMLDAENRLIDRLIALAFDMFDARRVTVRVFEQE
jgi:hypothetical protein